MDFISTFGIISVQFLLPSETVSVGFREIDISPLELSLGNLQLWNHLKEILALVEASRNFSLRS
jgi:hypothetical protein